MKRKIDYDTYFLLAFFFMAAPCILIFLDINKDQGTVKISISTLIVLYCLSTMLTYIFISNLIKEKIREANIEIIGRLNYAVKFKDNDTGNHIERIGRYSLLIAQETGMKQEWCEDLKKSSAMHDIGKVGVPDFILKKKGKLTEQEWGVMRKHPEIGAEIIGESRCPLLTMARSVAISHHEKWDGTGYPYGLSREQIPLAARIVAVADVFDALISERVYKKSWPIDDAVSFIKSQSGKHFDPNVVDAFLKSLDKILESEDCMLGRHEPCN